LNKIHSLELLLLEVERAWAYSQDLISLSSQPTNESKASTLAHSATARFRRAVHWSTQLLSYCQSLFASSRLSSENLLQATIYTLIINGRFLRYRDHFEDALVQLCVARHLLDELASTTSLSRDQALAVLYSDQISPEIRYCAHELGHPEAYNVQSIVKTVASKHLYEIVENCEALIENLKAEAAASSKIAGRRKLDTLMWEGQPIPVRDPGLVDVLLKVQEAEARLSLQGSGTAPPKTPEQGSKVKPTDRASSKKGVAAYDMILLALSDAEELARKLVEVQQVSVFRFPSLPSFNKILPQISGTNSGTLATGTRDIHFVHAYIVYQLLSRRIQRDLLLISALFSSQESLQTHHPSSSHKLPSIAKPKPDQVDGRLYPAVVKLLDTVLQSLNQMRTLSIVDESPDLASAVEARVSFTKARR
jgi:signal recognition particle subunit SRP68